MGRNPFTPQRVSSPDIDVEVIDDTDLDTSDIHTLILWNDEVNTFDHVIESLVEICDHSPQQAEQCALLIHFKGKCGVKNGDFETLRPLAEAFIDRNINATID